MQAAKGGNAYVLEEQEQMAEVLLPRQQVLAAASGRGLASMERLTMRAQVRGRQKPTLGLIVTAWNARQRNWKA